MSQYAYNLQLFFSNLYRCIPRNIHAEDLHIISEQLEEWRINQEFNIHQRENISINNANDSINKKNSTKIADYSKLLLRLQTNTDIQMLKQLLDKFRLLVSLNENTQCTCDTNDCLIQFAKAFVWIGGIKYFIPAILLNAEMQLRVTALRIVALSSHLSTLCNDSICTSPPDNFKCISEYLDVQQELAEEFKNRSEEMSMKKAAPKEKVSIDEETEKLETHSFPGEFVLSKKSRVSENFNRRYSATFGKPSSVSQSTSIFGIRSVGDLLSWTNVCNDYISWLYFYTNQGGVLSIPIITLLLFYLTHPIDAEFVASTRPLSEASMRALRLADINPPNNLLTPKSLASPIMKNDERRGSIFNEKRLSLIRPAIGDDVAFISNVRLLYFLFQECQNAPGNVIVCMFSILFQSNILVMLEQITYLFLSEINNLKLFLTLPIWQTCLIKLLIHNEVTINYEKQIVRLVINLFTISFHYYFTKTQSLDIILTELLQTLRTICGWNSETSMLVRLLLFSLICKIQSSLDFVYVPTSNAWVNIFNLIDFIYQYTCKLPVQLKVLKIMASKNEIEDYYKFGLHLEKGCECPDLIILSKLDSLFTSFQMNSWKHNVKSHLNSLDIERGLYSMFNSTYGKSKGLIKSIAAKGIAVGNFINAMIQLMISTHCSSETLSKSCTCVAISYQTFDEIKLEDLPPPSDKIDMLNILPIELFSQNIIVNPWSFKGKPLSVNSSGGDSSAYVPKPGAKHRTSFIDMFLSNKQALAEEVARGLYDNIRWSLELIDKQKSIDMDVRVKFRDTTFFVMQRMIVLRLEAMRAESLPVAAINLSPGVISQHLASPPNATIKPSPRNSIMSPSTRRHTRTLTQDLEAVKLDYFLLKEVAIKSNDTIRKNKHSRAVTFTEPPLALDLAADIPSPNIMITKPMSPLPVASKQLKIIISSDHIGTPPPVTSLPNLPPFPQIEPNFGFKLASISESTPFSDHLSSPENGSTPPISFSPNKLRNRRDSNGGLALNNSLFLEPETFVSAPPPVELFSNASTPTEDIETDRLEQEVGILAPSLNPTINELTKKIVHHLRYYSV